MCQQCHHRRMDAETTERLSEAWFKLSFEVKKVGDEQIPGNMKAVGRGLGSQG